jgi:hypothetical protein
MKRTLSAAASLALVVVTVPAHAQAPLIVIDRWWGVDYAKNSCFIALSKAAESPRPTAAPSTQPPWEELLRRERQRQEQVICEKERTEKACGPRWYHELQERAICEQERTEKYNVFELELTTQFAASLECAGITVVTYGGPGKNPNSPFPDLSQLPYWSFSISSSTTKPRSRLKSAPPNAQVRVAPTCRAGSAAG